MRRDDALTSYQILPATRVEIPVSGVRQWVSSASSAERRIDIYRIDLDTHAEQCGRFEAVLSDSERAHCARFADERLKRRAVISRGAFRMIVAAYVGRSATHVPLVRDAWGKPRLAPNAACQPHNLHVSCSRSGRSALFAVAAGMPIGVDIEAVTSARFPSCIEEFMLSSLEHRAYATVPQSARPAWLARIWVCKEAILKGLGRGLQMHPASICVAPSADRPKSMPAWTSREATHFPPWRLCEHEGSGSVAAIAIRGKPSSLMFAELGFQS